MSDVSHPLSVSDRRDEDSADQLLPSTYAELSNLAAAKMAQEEPGQSLQPAALVHEAWLRLSSVNAPAFSIWNLAEVEAALSEVGLAP